MRILLTTEGTYPSIMGGVSTWCDQLVRGLTGHAFQLLEVTGPLPSKPVYELPANVAGLDTVHLWRRRSVSGSRSRTNRLVTGTRFDHGLEQLLGFTRDDLGAFGAGLLQLARLGAVEDLWDYLDRPNAWQLVRSAMGELIGEPPTLGEVAVAMNWLRGTLVPLLYVPIAADQAHTTSAGLSAIPAWIVAKEHRVPLMLTEHGLYLRERYLSLSTEQNPAPVKLLRARFYRALAMLLYVDSDLVVSVSEFNRTWQVELGAPVERTRVVYNGVAPSAFPDAGDSVQQAPTVSWVGRIDPVKDLETLVASFRHVRAEAPKAQLRLFGPVPRGNEGYAERVQNLVKDLDLATNVVFEGPVSPVHRAYHAADVVALSSISEGFPYVAIEAMMCGRPVVATRVGGVGEAVGAFGRMVEPRSPREFGGALIELLADVSLRRRLGVGARARALELFTLDRMHDGYRRLYAELDGSSAWLGAA
ncbi:MAG: GT4 family glycosyltransferase PelF [Trueperaceae bacterium]